jgi:hypothetical protein
MGVRDGRDEDNVVPPGAQRRLCDRDEEDNENDRDDDLL